jgi:hypothetical protein
MTSDSSDDSFWNRFNENVVIDPSGQKLVDVSNLTEKELVGLFERNWEKAKRFRTGHSLKHGYLLNCAAILKKLYLLNLHKWGRDEGRSTEDLRAFEEKLRKGFNPSERGKE